MIALFKNSLVETNFFTRITDSHQREIVISYAKQDIQEYINRKYKNLRNFLEKKQRRDEEIFIACVEEEIIKAESINSQEKYFEGFES